MNKEELDLLEIVFTLAIGEWVFNDINDLQKLEDKIKAIDNLCKKQKEVIDNAVKYIDNLRDESAERQGFYNCFTDDLYIADINELLDILKEVSE